MKPYKHPTAEKLAIMSIMLVFVGLLTIVCSSVALAQMINPFGVNNGNILSKADFQQGGIAATKLLEDTPKVGRYESWSNPVSGNHGRLTILDIFTSKNLPCRKVKSYVVYSKAGSAPGTKTLDVCKLPSGEWKIVS